MYIGRMGKINMLYIYSLRKAQEQDQTGLDTWNSVNEWTKRVRHYYSRLQGNIHIEMTLSGALNETYMYNNRFNTIVVGKERENRETVHYGELQAAWWAREKT